MLYYRYRMKGYAQSMVKNYSVAFSYALYYPGVIEIPAENEKEVREILVRMTEGIKDVVVHQIVEVPFSPPAEVDTPPVKTNLN